MATSFGLVGPEQFSAAPVGGVFATAPDALRPLLFLDLEASSLGPGSWPIEIGCAWIEDGEVMLREALIAPRPEWQLGDWSDVSARCHGLTMAQVMAGRDADEVAAATDALADFDVVSDNPRWDQVWLDRLREGRPRIIVRHVRAAAAARLPGPAADIFALTLLRSIAPHRAGGDARRLADAWCVATRRYDLAA